MIPEIIVNSFAIKCGISTSRSLFVFERLEKFFSNALSGGEKVPDEEIDEGWHHFLTEPDTYREYCIARYGKVLIHIPEINSTTRPGKARCRIDWSEQ
jgi:hypothetical protein